MYKSKIAALAYVSESEISKIYKDYHHSWEEVNPEKFKSILFQFGLDISWPYEKQESITHRNKLNQIVKCNRWVGNSRMDSQWLNSGLASKECLDKAKNNKLLDDVYRSKYLTEDAQNLLEARDKYATITTEED